MGKEKEMWGRWKTHHHFLFEGTVSFQLAAVKISVGVGDSVALYNFNYMAS